MKFNIIDSFPDFKGRGFCMETYNRQFHDSNIIIHANACRVHYPEHWGPLSVKCVFSGKEYYRANNCNLAVDGKKYLILNNGNYYSSYINADSNVESFTINFTSELLNDAIASFAGSNEFIMENPG